MIRLAFQKRLFQQKRWIWIRRGWTWTQGNELWRFKINLGNSWLGDELKQQKWGWNKRNTYGSELWSWEALQRCSKQRQAGQVFLPLHGPAIGCGLPSWRSSAPVGAAPFNQGQLPGDSSDVISGSDAPGSWRKRVPPGSVGHSTASTKTKEQARSSFTRSNSFSPHDSPARRYHCYSYFTDGEPQATASK